MIEYIPPPGIEFDVRHKIGWPVRALDANGVERSLDGGWQVSILGEGAAQEDPNVPGRIEFITGSNPGVTDVIVGGDADLGTGVVFISETFRFNPGAAPVPMAATVGSSGFESPTLK